MPNYKYKCTECDIVVYLKLPISSNPKTKYYCHCTETTGTMTRRITCPNFQIERETLGKWYKDNTGRELMGE